MAKIARFWVMLEKEKSDFGREFEFVFETNNLTEAKEKCEEFSLKRNRSAIVKDLDAKIESIIFRYEALPVISVSEPIPESLPIVKRSYTKTNKVKRK